MSNSPDGVTWLQDAHGTRIGLQVIETEEQRFVRVVFPGGVEKLVSNDDAKRVVGMLMDGIAFSGITGAEAFRVSPEDF